MHLVYMTGNYMPQIRRSALMSFSASQMYQLVNDIDAYQNFLPGCIGSRVIQSSDHEMIAAMDIEKAGIIKTITTRNTLLDNQSINMQLVHGPFHKLMGEWHFIPVSHKACQVDLELYFEFTNTIIEILFCNYFKELAGNMVQIFQQQAQKVYSVLYPS